MQNTLKHNIQKLRVKNPTNRGCNTIVACGAKSDAGYFIAVHPGAEPGGPRGAGTHVGFCFYMFLFPLTLIPSGGPYYT